MDIRTWLTVAAVLVSLASLVAGYLYRRNDSSAELKKQLTDACIDIAILKKQMAVFWNVVETNAGKMLHAPTHHRRDELIERLVGERPPPLTIEEVDELSCEMQAIIDAPQERIPGERMYAILMRGRLEAKKAKYEMLKTSRVNKIKQC